MKDFRKPIVSLHEFAGNIAQANQWPWVYSLGYASGRDDREAGRKSEHRQCENEYELGYHKGYSATDAPSAISHQLSS